LQRLIKKSFLLFIDFILVSVAVYVALFCRFDQNIPQQYIKVYINTVLVTTCIKLFTFQAFKLYSSLWQYASVEELIQVFLATTIGTVLSFLFGMLTNQSMPRTVYIIAWMVTFMLVGGSRLSYRLVRKANSWAPRIFAHRKCNHQKRVMIIGAGSAGSLLIRQLKFQKELRSVPVVVIDDDCNKQGSHIHGIPIKGGREQIEKMCKKYRVDEIIIALPSKAKNEIKEILEICTRTKCKLKTLPELSEITNDNIDLKKIRDVSIEDLLGREQVRLNNSEISDYISGQVVLVTGGGGSIGSELCRQIAKYRPSKLLILDKYENSAYDLQNELQYKYGDKLDFEIIIACVRDRERMESIFKKYRPDIVFHAAAHKHVPLMEANPTEAIKNNIFGTLNVAECAHEYHAKRFVLISTDKAVNPTNIMGATKRIAEMIIQSMSKRSKTEFVAVRFGNVLGSNGSVIPLFKKQIEHGGPVTVTHPEVTRFFMTIPEAAQLVIQAGAMAKGGEIFILDMGAPIKIVDLARNLIRLSGLEPDKDIKIEFTGLRPGEKLHEELLMEEEGVTATHHEKIFISQPLNMDYKLLMKELNNLAKMVSDSDESLDGLADIISRIVPTYSNEQAAV